MSGIITQNELNDSLNKNERYLHGISYLFYSNLIPSIKPSSIIISTGLL